MKHIKRCLAIILCICILFANQTLLARATQRDNGDNSIDSIATDTDASNTDAEQSSNGGSGCKLNWLVVGSDYIEAPGMQYALVDIGNEGTIIESAKLLYINKTTGVTNQVEASSVQGSTILFNINHDSSEQGIYELVTVEYIIADIEYFINISEMGFSAQYGVNTEIDAEPTAWIVDEESTLNDADITITDSNGNMVNQASLQDLLDGTAVQSQELQPKGASENGETVIVLSPGHGEGKAGSSTSGTIRTWDGVTYVERDLALKIAYYCKEELEKNSGIKVYMTRYDNASELSIEGRVQYAKSVNADLYVSIHLNSTESNSTTAHGAEVLIPSANYNPDQHEKASELAQHILNRLVELGLTNRGTVIRYSENGTTYEDGSLADYYGEVKYCKLNNIPGVIVEHAFLNNPNEAKQYLGSEQALKSLGVADAKGILDYISNNQKVSVTCSSNTQGIDISAQYIGDKAYQYRFLAYNVEKKQWELISDWNSKNTVQWKPEKGNYWLQVEVGINGERITYDIVTYNSDINYRKPYVKMNGICFSNTDKAIRAGVSYESNDDLIQFRWLSYNLSTQSWQIIQDWSSNNWLTDWKPQMSTYWLRSEAMCNDGTVESYTITYTPDRDYSKAYIDLLKYITVDNGDSISVHVTYNTNIDSLEFRWLSYNLSTQSWELIRDWSSANQVDWRPDKATYWLRVEVRSVGGGVENNYTETYASTRNYNEKYIRFNGYCIIPSDTEVNAGVAYESNEKNVEFRWLAYNLSTQSWELIQDWSSSNWMSWKPAKCDYWLRVEAKSSDGGIDSNYTRIYSSIKNYNESYIYLNGFCILENELAINVGVAYESNEEDVKFRWLCYNLSTKSWELIQDWSSSNWMSWKPAKGDYWLRVEAKSAKGTENNYTITYTSDINYNSSYVSVNTVNVIENGSIYTLKAKYATNCNSVKFRWLAYNLTTQQWRLLSDWGDDDFTEWNPDTGNDYWIRVEAITDDGYSDIWCEAYHIDKYSIMGTSSVTLRQMVNYYNANAKYPEFYASSDAPTIEQFCQIYIEECAAEGVKTEVAFCQAMKETGFLKFGGLVNINQYNFAGIGASGQGASSACFSSVREGVRGQVQHLKAYASKDKLNNVCVDPRYNLVTKGSAPYVEWLGINENPNGCGWATAIKYGYSIKKDYISKLLQY